MKRLVLAVLLVAAAFATAGCGNADFNHAEINGVKPSPLGGNMNYARVEVPVGMIVVANIVAYDDDHKTMAIDIQEKDKSVVDITNVISEHDYAFWGKTVGTTDVEIKANDKLIMIVKATVTPQPTP
jgi:hypothetical protein